MNASDISPAVTRPIAVPLNGAGTSAALIRSRSYANRINTIENPSAAPNP